jgi:hypothetical protein
MVPAIGVAKAAIGSCARKILILQYFHTHTHTCTQLLKRSSLRKQHAFSFSFHGKIILSLLWIHAAERIEVKTAMVLFQSGKQSNGPDLSRLY